MALKNVSKYQFDFTEFGEPVALTSLEIGESVEGYCLGFVKSKHENGGDNMVFADTTSGEKFSVYSAGNVKYQIADGEIAVGIYTKITRVADKMVKGKSSSQYQTEQDDEHTAPDWKPTASAGTNTDHKSLS